MFCLECVWDWFLVLVIKPKYDDKEPVPIGPKHVA